MVVKNTSVVEFKKLSGWFLALGILFMLFGFLLMILPTFGSITFELLFGLLLLVLGISELALAFQARKWTGCIFLLLGGILSIIAAVILLFNPIGGLIAITLLLGLYLLIHGLIGLFRAITLKPGYSWGWLLFDGLISILLGLLIISAWPMDSTWVVGLLFGIDLLFGGITFIMLSQAAK